MKIAITDASIFIDLYELGCLDWLVKLEFEIHTTTLVLNELSQDQLKLVTPIVSVVQPLSFEDLETLTSLDVPRGLSDTDRSLLWYSRQLSPNPFLLLTSDNLMRKWSLNHQIEVHGIFWLFDQMVENQYLYKKEALELLMQLMRINQWLPAKECELRQKAWKE